MLTTLNKLKAEVKANKEIKNSILGYSDIWKAHQYNTLADIINESLMKSPELQGEKKFMLGNTLSAITLKRFFEDKISDTAFTDLRFIKTLDKISIFVGYENFNDFINKNKNKDLEISEKVTEPIDALSRCSYEEIIRNCAQCEFDFILKLPEINLKPLEDFVIKNSPYYSRIHNYLHQLCEQEKVMSKDLNSNFEIFNIVLESKDEHSVVLSTSEFWNLNFRSKNGKQHHYNTLNEQNYFLKKSENGEWKIWDNYNPNVWDLTDRI